MRDGGHAKATAVHFEKDGCKRSRGSEHLKSTQAYPFGFGCSHALAFAETSSSSHTEMPPALELDPDDTDDSDLSSDDSCLADIRANDPEMFLGKFSLTMVVGISALALTEPANHEDLRKLAGLGTDVLRYGTVTGQTVV